MKVDWIKRYQDLAKLHGELAKALEKVSQIQNRIDYHVGESDRLELSERQVHRYLKLKEDITLPAIYNENSRYGTREVMHTYKKDTLIQAIITGKIAGTGGTANVYLDDDGDGMLFFPGDKLEEVEIPYEDEQNYKIVYQG